MKWPKEVEIADNIGRAYYYLVVPERPCCAIGHAAKEFIQCGNELSIEGIGKGVPEFREAYAAVAKAHRGIEVKRTTEFTNDAIEDPAIRALLYNAAWAYLGYTDGQSKEVLDLAKRAKNGTESA